MNDFDNWWQNIFILLKEVKLFYYMIEWLYFKIYNTSHKSLEKRSCLGPRTKKSHIKGKEN